MELPEVEIIVTVLNKKIIGQQIEKVEIFKPQMLERCTTQEVEDNLSGQTITSCIRRGKLILKGMSNGAHLITHPRMTGIYHYYQGYKPPIQQVNKLDNQIKQKMLKSLNFKEIFARSNVTTNKYTRMILYFSRGGKLYYQDKRALGKIFLYRPGEPISALAHLGVEPLTEEFTAKLLKEKLHNCRRQLKPLLLDQRIIVGIGNIYAAEILYHAGISPFKRGNELNDEELWRLVKAAKAILKKAIALRGTHISDFKDPQGEEGEFWKELCVYQQAGNLCSRCGHRIAHTRQQQRSTYFCPGCQAL